VTICDIPTRNVWEEATADNIARWERDGRGPMAASGAKTGGSVRTRDGLASPDVQYHVIAVLFDRSGLPLRRAVSVLVTALDVQSRGWYGCAARTRRTAADRPELPRR
jgi:hypothetical protein